MLYNPLLAQQTNTAGAEPEFEIDFVFYCCLFSERFSEEKLVIIGSMILGTNFILLLSTDTIIVYGAAILFAFGNGLMWPPVLSILSKRAGTVQQGAVQGVANSFESLASIIGLTVGGLLYNIFGATTFLVSAGVIFTVFIMSFRLLKMQ